MGIDTHFTSCSCSSYSFSSFPFYRCDLAGYFLGCCWALAAIGTAAEACFAITVACPVAVAKERVCCVVGVVVGELISSHLEAAKLACPRCPFAS